MDFSPEYPILSNTLKGGVGMEHTSASYRTYRTSGRPAARKRGGGTKSGLSPKERVRLGQLCVCLALFLIVFVGKGAFPQQLAQLQGKLVSVLTADTDFRAAFSKLGESLGSQGSVLGELEDFCVEVFGIQPTAQGQTMDETQSQAQREQGLAAAPGQGGDADTGGRGLCAGHTGMGRHGGHPWLTEKRQGRGHEKRARHRPVSCPERD